MAINSFNGSYRFLSNFYNASVTYDDITYCHVEAAYQAQKVKDIALRREFANLSASEAKRLGRKLPLRPDWENIKVCIMRELVKAKFDQHDELKWYLIATGNEYLEEGNTWGDTFWGTVDGVGENHLGKILMDLRSEYIAEDSK